MIKGTIMEIGKEDSTGLVDILIQTTRDEIKRVTINPIYRLVEISLPCENDNKPEVKSSHGKFPSLVECEEIVRKSMSRNNLTHHHFTDQDKHIIGTLWAYLERVYNET